MRYKCSNPGSLNNVFRLTYLHGGAEVRDLGHMQMSLLVIFSACVDPSGARSRIISTSLASMCRHSKGGKDMLNS